MRGEEAGAPEVGDSYMQVRHFVFVSAMYVNWFRGSVLHQWFNQVSSAGTSTIYITDESAGAI